MKLSKKFSYIANERWPAVVYLTRTICSLVMRQAIWALICPENCRIIVSIWETAHLPLPSSINTNALSVDCCWVRGRVGAQLLSHETEGGGGYLLTLHIQVRQATRKCNRDILVSIQFYYVVYFELELITSFYLRVWTFLPIARE